MATEVQIAGDSLGFCGNARLFQHNGNWYQVVIFPALFPNSDVAIFKSTNHGTSWTNPQSLSSIGIQNPCFGTILIGTVIYIVYAPNPNSGTAPDNHDTTVVAFDMATDSLTTFVGQGATPAVSTQAGQADILLAGLSSSLIYVFWDNWNAGSHSANTINVGKYASASFSQIGTVTGGNNTTLLTVFQGSSGIVHCLYADSSSPTAACALKYFNVNAGVISGSSTVIASGSGSTLTAGQQDQIGFPIQIGSTIYFSVYSDETQDIILLSFPDTASPSFSTSNIETGWVVVKGATNGIGLGANVVLGLSGSTIYAFYTNSNEGIPNPTSGDGNVYYRSSSNGGVTWSARQTLVSHIDPDLGTSAGVNWINTPQLVSGALNPLAVTYLETSNATGAATIDERFVLAGISPPPVVTCPPLTLATINAAYSSAFGVSGGASPFTFVIISGALPPGLVLNANTGAISGTATQTGIFAFEVQVTDSNGSTGTANCSITVNAISQLIFQGVRRKSGTLPPLVDLRCYNPKSFTWTEQLSITATGNYPAELQSVVPQTVIQQIYDYPFQWEELRITYQGTGSRALSQIVTALMLYDPVKQEMANLPVLDVFYNGAPLSEYANGAQVPPLIYPAQGEIRVDVWSLIQDPSVLPVTMTLHFIGKRLIPR